MDGMLSQEEINALLNGMGGEDAAQDTAADTAAVTAADTAAPQPEDLTLAESDKDAVGYIS